MAKWKRYLLNFDKIVQSVKDSNVTYRHGVKAIPISRIAQQYYCEYKVDLSYRFGDVSTPEKERGKLLHDIALHGEKIDMKDLVKEITNTEIIVSNFPIVTKIYGEYVCGVADAVVFAYGFPIYVVELKTSRKRRRIFYNEVFQAELYALALQYIGFDCNYLRLLIIKTDTVTRDLVQSVLNDIEFSLDDATKNVCYKIYEYDWRKALEGYKWARDYWLGLRDPVPTTKKNKCKVCEYKEVCEYSLA